MLNNNKIPLPNRIKTSKYLIHFLTLILEIRSLNIESFDKTSKSDLNIDIIRKDSITNDKVNNSIYFHLNILINTLLNNKKNLRIPIFIQPQNPI